jgi:hypothetical protein
MTKYDLEVCNGPDKADLLRAVTNPDKHVHVSFETSGELVEAHIDAIEELRSDGMVFGLRGHLTTGNLRGAVFTGTYDCGSRVGHLMLQGA